MRCQDPTLIIIASPGKLKNEDNMADTFRWDLVKDIIFKLCIHNPRLHLHPVPIRKIDHTLIFQGAPFIYLWMMFGVPLHYLLRVLFFCTLWKVLIIPAFMVDVAAGERHLKFCDGSQVVWMGWYCEFCLSSEARKCKKQKGDLLTLPFKQISSLMISWWLVVFWLCRCSDFSEISEI